MGHLRSSETLELPGKCKLIKFADGIVVVDLIMDIEGLEEVYNLAGGC